MRPSRTTQQVTSGKRMLAQIRSRIVDGAYAPGARLPPRPVLERRYKAGPVTVQRVFDHLAAEGFVVARGRQGTFVSDSPPHLCDHALVFPYRDAPYRRWPLFWHTLAECAKALDRPGLRVSFSYGNETHQDVEAYQQLLDDIACRRLAGIIFASPPFYLLGSPVIEDPNLPRVAVMSEPLKGVKAVNQGGDWLGTALQEVLAAGRRRVAVLTVPGLEGVAAQVLDRPGVISHPYWVQTVPLGAPAARRIVHLLMAANPADRPDALLIMDDNLVESATVGLVDAKMRVPDDVMVVAHCNFPHLVETVVPVTWLGYDVAALLDACLDNLARQRRGERAPDFTGIPVVTQREMAEQGRLAAPVARKGR